MNINSFLSLNRRTGAISKLAAPLGLALLASCAINDGAMIYRGEELPQSPAEEAAPPDPFLQQRILADMLYEARVAYEDNRLMSPPGNNAYARYLEVLAVDPDNAVALQGLEEIVLRYVALADAAMGIGQYDDAASLLRRAAALGRQEEALAAAWDRLEEARSVDVELFPLNPEELRQQSLEIMVELAEIAQHVFNEGAIFLINARSDEEGRWIYKIMREAVGGSRLRGNIAIGTQPSVQVTLP